MVSCVGLDSLECLQEGHLVKVDVVVDLVPQALLALALAEIANSSDTELHVCTCKRAWGKLPEDTTGVFNP